MKAQAGASERMGVEVDAARGWRARRWVGLLGVGAMVTCGVLASWPVRGRASVEAQRARLPPPAETCPDPVEGIWLGHTYINGAWHKFALHIDREGERLMGRIDTHVWTGPQEQSEPPPCEGGYSHEEFTLEQPSEGSFVDNVVTFTGQSYKVTEEICGGAGGYSPDSFSGELIYKGTEFHTINDDGVNPAHTVVLRRVRCGPSPDKPIPELPPSLPTPTYATGCGGCF